MASPKRVAITFAAAAWVAIMSANSVLAAGTEQAHVAHGPWAVRPPKVVLISLDGAKPDLIQHYLRSGALSWQSGLGRLVRNGVVAGQNITATPSLTAVSHIAIATGSTAAHNDISANTYHAIAQPIGQTLSGFGGPIGGYQFSPLGIDPTPTAEPLWVRLRNAGKKVVTATWPGGDGVDVRINNVIVQPANPTRVVNYTVPFGAFGGLGATGFTLTSADFSPDAAVSAQLSAAGKTSFGTVLATTLPFETFFCASTTAGTCGTSASATLDLKFESVPPPSTPRTTVRRTTTHSPFSRRPRESSQGLSRCPRLDRRTSSSVASRRNSISRDGRQGRRRLLRLAFRPRSFDGPPHRYGANFIPRNTPVIADVDDINNNVGFWSPQPDFRIPERLSPGFTAFPDIELEAMYEDQVETFIRYQSQIARRAILRNPGADLVMIYIEEPDGSGHQFTLTDRRQATSFTDPNSIGANQDPAKVARYASYVKFAYRQADKAVDSILDLVGHRSNVFVVSDHGMAPFHTAVSLTNLLRNAGIDVSKLAIRPSGAAANIYVNLLNRESGGTVANAEYQALVNQIASVLEGAQDINPTFNYSLRQRRIFTDVVKRPFSCLAGIGFCTSRTIGQDFGDVFVMLAEGYNFDGIQNPGVARLGELPFNRCNNGILAAELLRCARPQSEPAFDERDFHRGGTRCRAGQHPPRRQHRCGADNHAPAWREAGEDR